MSLLELGGKRFTIPAGEVFLGSDAGCAIRLTGTGLLPRHAVLQGFADGQVVIRKAAPEADVTINGVRLGAEPTPLLHGDKVQVAGHEFSFVDERRSGSTQYMSAMKVPEATAQAKAAAPSGAGRPTANTGGRVVCLTDGREYTITGTSLVFGREAGCDVVVPGKDVSRRHAEIVASPKGYLLVDSSTNGTFVNEEQVQGQRLLARGDVLRIGDEKFRFYADLAAPASGPQPGPAASAPQAAPPPPSAPRPSTAPPAPAPPAPRPPVAAAPAPSPPAGAGSKLRNTAFGPPPVSSPPPQAVGPATAPLAHLVVRSGALKGQRVSIRTPIVNIGRADYNDVHLPEESVSTSHAKLQRREGVWVLVDLDSTNGTFVDGERVQGETPLAPGALVRFGDVQVLFDPTSADDAMGVAKGGGTKVMQSMKAAQPPSPAKPAAPAPKAPVKPARAATPAPKRPAGPPAAPKKGKGCGASAAVLVLGVAACVYWLLV
ncbi:MAG: hypothetical protein DMD41_04825 [Gemmatimonadetes bacterium]|nr:MAG: hypothetical protein DMD41_04825 [Gemmatimonadota bacterium]